MPERWKPSVTVAAIIERDGLYLLVEEHTPEGLRLNNPAGHLDPGEAPAEACARETLEETAHRFRPTSLVGIYRWVYRPAQVKERRGSAPSSTPDGGLEAGTTFFRFAFAGTLEGVEEGRALDREIRALHWMTPDEIRARAADHRSPLLQQCVDDYVAGRRFPIDVLSAAYA